MLKMNQVLQIGEIEGNVHYYIEDYAYTFLKKQDGEDRKKYFLYGEKEETKEKIKLYIYGIGQKPKMEQSYFKEYYPLGFLKIKEEGNYWINLNGQENEIKGFYVFYAPNQAMQEYLVDYHKEEQREETTEKTSKRKPVQMLPMKETTVSKKIYKKKSSKEEKILYSVGAVFIAFLFLLTLTTTNGQNKMKIFKQVIEETMSNSVSAISEDFIIEENTPQQTNMESKEMQQREIQTCTISEKRETEEKLENKENDQVVAETITAEEDVMENIKTEEEKIMDETTKEANTNQNESEDQTQYEEYIVQNGDTLVAICKKRYNSLLKMEEICKLNNIKNADYIAPGQKLYLP